MLLHSPLRSPLRSPLYSPLVGKWGTAVPNGALVTRAGNFILDRNNNYIVTATAPRTS